MTDVALFGVGLLVTLLVAAAVALLIVGAVMDGHENEQAQAERGAPDVMVGGPSPIQSKTSTP
jgi:hypothetical protein